MRLIAYTYVIALNRFIHSTNVFKSIALAVVEENESAETATF